MKKQFINLTPHDVNVVRHSDQEVVKIPSYGIVSRVREVVVTEKLMDDFRFTMKEPGEIINLPEPQENTYFIVSAQVAEKAQRPDVISPGDLIRNDRGEVIGCKGFRFWV
jgi:hypothetical protein